MEGEAAGWLMVRYGLVSGVRVLCGVSARLIAERMVGWLVVWFILNIDQPLPLGVSSYTVTHTLLPLLLLCCRRSYCFLPRAAGHTFHRVFL